MKNVTNTFLCLSRKETLAPLYQSTAAGGPGGPKCSPCETSKLICQTPLTVSDESPCTYPTPAPEVKISVPIEATGKASEEEEEVEANGERAIEDPNRGRGEPEEVSEEEAVDDGFRLLTGSCTCVVPVRQPLEVGENEDCSQAVSPGTPGICSCGSESRKDEKQKEDSVATQTGGDKSFGNGDRMLLSRSVQEFPSPLTHPSCSPPLPELGPQLCQDQAELKSPQTDSLLLRQELDGLTSPKTASPSAGDPLKPPMNWSPEQGRGLSCRDSRGSKLPSAEAQLECPPESLHSQLTEPNLTSGWSEFHIHAPIQAHPSRRMCTFVCQMALISCQADPVLFVCVGALPQYFHRVSSVHLIPQFARSEFAVQATRKNRMSSNLALLLVRKKQQQHIFVLGMDFSALKTERSGLVATVLECSGE